MHYDEFISLALYHPTLGYYRKQKQRVGKSERTDFYTSNSIGEPWGKMIIEACTQILEPNDLRNYSFVEIAAEPKCSVLNQVDHPFKSSITFRLGDTIKIPKYSIVFSNEWLDAQPFKRFKFDAISGEWMEIGVSLVGNTFNECTFSTKQPTAFPVKSVDGYTIDWPTGAKKAIDDIISQSWRGLFLTFDYGLSQNIILHERPDGTARGYYRHQIMSDLLSQPGEQDLTCHLCWDELRESLKQNNFVSPKVQTQEAFFMHHSQNTIKNLFAENNGSLNFEMQKLKELIHPQHLGNKFQALWAIRN